MEGGCDPLGFCAAGLRERVEWEGGIPEETTRKIFDLFHLVPRLRDVEESYRHLTSGVDIDLIFGDE